MAKTHDTDLLTVKLAFNGKTDVSAIYKDMQKMFDQVAPAYKGKTNRTETAIKASLTKANQVIYREARMKAPRIRPDIQAAKQKSRKDVHLSDKEYMVERAAAGKVWRKQGIIARRVVTFKAPVSSYVAAIEYGRDEFVQVAKKKAGDNMGGETGFYMRHVGAMKAQPFLRKAQNSKAQVAIDTFATVLSKKWINILARVAKVKANKGK